jgi:hypothetical protein
VSDFPTLSRPDFYDGQALTASDLNAVQAYHRELLWLHQRTLHGSGIASGLTVTGAKGDKAVTVAPGYAIDVAGRSVVLDASRVLDIPAVVGGPAGQAVTYYLTVAYVPDDELAPTERAGICGANGAVRRKDQPALAWRAPGETGQEIVLCGISVSDCKLRGPVDLSPRRSALPERQPFIYAGQSSPAESNWAIWYGDEQARAPLFGLRAVVNTSQAGFVNTPEYQATVVGSRTVDAQDGSRIPAVIDGHVQIHSATADGFELFMALPRGDDRVNPAWALTDKDLLGNLPSDKNWFVSWLGVES